MPLTERMLEGAIAANPGQPDKAGEYRYCRQCDIIYFTRPKQPDIVHTDHSILALPALSPDGSERLARAFRAFIKRWSAERQSEIECFAARRGWELAYEHHSGGGALDDGEVAEWHAVVDAELKRLIRQFRTGIAIS